jgi:hypothetical protein
MNRLHQVVGTRTVVNKGEGGTENAKRSHRWKCANLATKRGNPASHTGGIHKSRRRDHPGTTLTHLMVDRRRNPTGIG